MLVPISPPAPRQRVGRRSAGDAFSLPVSGNGRNQGPVAPGSVARRAGNPRSRSAALVEPQPALARLMVPSCREGASTLSFARLRLGSRRSDSKQAVPRCVRSRSRLGLLACGCAVAAPSTLQPTGFLEIRQRPCLCRPVSRSCTVTRLSSRSSRQCEIRTARPPGRGSNSASGAIRSRSPSASRL